MISPLLGWAAFFCLGIITGNYLTIDVGLLLVASFISFLAGIIFLKREKWCLAFILLLGFFAGGLGLTNARMPSFFGLTSEALPSGDVVLNGVIVSDPVIGKREVSFLLRLKSARHGDVVCNASCVVGVRKYGFVSCGYGDKVIVQGRLLAQETRGNKATDGRGAPFILSVRKNQDILFSGSEAGYLLGRLVFSLKHKMEGIMRSALPSSSASVLTAMLLGEGAGVPPPLKSAMLKAGTWHVMVVSGTNTSLAAFMLLIILKISRVPRRLRFSIAIACLFVYCFLTGASAPVVRATVMTSVLLLTFLLERNPLFHHSFALAALAILLFDPRQLFSLGFQLSFLSVFFIVEVFTGIKEFFAVGMFGRPVFSAVAACLAVSFAAWAGTAPLIAQVFGTVAPFAVVTNLVVVPLASLVLFSGIALVSVGLILPSLVSPFAAGSDFLIFLFAKVNLVVASWPLASVSFAPISFPLMLCIYTFLFAAGFFLRRVSRSAQGA